MEGQNNMYDEKRRLYLPDMAPPEQQGWQQFAEDGPIDMAPAAGAFKQRFMSGPRNGAGTGTTPMPTANDLPMDVGGFDAGGGAPLKKGIKSL